MPELVIAPARNLSGAVRLPGDKSLSHRCALLAALGEGESKLANYSNGADCQSSLACVQALGATVTRAEADPSQVTITGVGLHGLRAPTGDLDAGNSGSTIRMFSGVLAAQPFASTIGGDASLSRRPMRRITDPLRQMGAQITAADGDRPPLHFQPPAQPLRAIEYVLPVASAQVKSAILLAGLFAQGTTIVVEPLATRDHTENLLRHLGVPLRRRLRPRAQIEIDGPVQQLAPLAQFSIPGDPSSAAFFLGAAAMFPESDLLVEDVSLNPTRSALLDLFARMGAQPQVVSVDDRGGELAGSLHLVRNGGRLTGATVEGAEAVALIDEIPILAVLATTTRDGIDFKDVGELRVKESDRLTAIAQNLRAMGATCKERPDGLFVPGHQQLHGARITTHDDHRIAMAFAIAALVASGDTTIDHPECAAISFPDFYTTLDRLADR
ncbi:MAG TPA: 3-phosphoshikimate 1-carboxyvinyltransferase [Terriglobales bacterium]|jgi:3-phosphoshikimate 1-carboxyvinyltransferase